LLPAIVDIFFSPLQNAAEYGLNGPEDSTVVELAHESGSTRVTISNPLPATTDRGELLQKVEILRREQQDGSYVQVVSGEGGTGLHKLLSHLVNLFGEPSFDFGVFADRFVVHFTATVPQVDENPVS
jgi:hypothetical protein